MQRRLGGSRISFSAVGFVMFKTEHGRFRIKGIQLELVSKLLVGVAVALVAGDRWNKSRAD